MKKLTNHETSALLREQAMEALNESISTISAYVNEHPESEEHWHGTIVELEEMLNRVIELTEENEHTMALQFIAEYLSVRNPKYWFFASEFYSIELRSRQSLSRQDNEYRYNLKETMMTKIEIDYGKEVKEQLTNALS